MHVLLRQAIKVPSISGQRVYKVKETESHFPLIIPPVNPDFGAINPNLAADSAEQATSIISEKLVIVVKRKLKFFLGLNS